MMSSNFRIWLRLAMARARVCPFIFLLVLMLHIEIQFSGDLCVVVFHDPRNMSRTFHFLAKRFQLLYAKGFLLPEDAGVDLNFHTCMSWALLITSRWYPTFCNTDSARQLENVTILCQLSKLRLSIDRFPVSQLRVFFVTFDYPIEHCLFRQQVMKFPTD